MTQKKRRYPKLLYLLTALLFLVLAGISLWSNSLRVPADSLPTPDELEVYPASYSDYLVIPYNIAPLNFRIENEAYDYITCFSGTKGKPVLVKGNVVEISKGTWRKLLEANKGEPLLVTVYVKRDGVWFHFPSVRYQVAEEPIDTWLVYRMTNPAFTSLGHVAIVQRNLETFREKLLVKRQSISNLKDTSLGNALFPAFHPVKSLYACAVDRHGKQVPVLDREQPDAFSGGSSIRLVSANGHDGDIQPTGTVNPGMYEAFPSWSNDGKQLFSSIAVVKSRPLGRDGQVAAHFNLTRRTFHASTNRLGPADTLVNASVLGKSALYPRLSPDGRHLLFCMTDNGKAPLWHTSSDLYLLNVSNGGWQRLDIVNSPEVDNQPCWSSNGRWILFGSNRQDGIFTRIYLAYFDKEGMVHKPFILPQREPEYDESLFLSYNTPEFVSEPTTADQLRLLVHIFDAFDHGN